jgi:hypothetical protein
MGIGDEIMAAGEARQRAAGSTRKFLMADKRGAPKWHWIWEGNPNIARPGETADGVIEYVNGRRPYIVDENVRRRQFRAYQPEPAFIALTPRARELAKMAAGAVVFNPTIKAKAPENKDWGFDNWKALVTNSQDIHWIMLAEPGGPRMRGCEMIDTPNFADACGLIAGAAAVVCNEGALHHAAAAFGTPAVVIRGGYISPRVTGYAGQVDLYVEDPDYPQFADLGCGSRISCPHCQAAMSLITPHIVEAALRTVLEKGRPC